jgi:XTP/dITP diphosphohydrolase
MKEITIVTGNSNKLNEFKIILGNNIKSENIDLLEIQSFDLKEICEHKVREAYKILKTPVVVEDTGFFIDELNGLPGPFIKFFEDKLGNGSAVTLLGDSENRLAKQICMIAYYDGNNLFFCEGTMEGTVSNEVRGGEGFGFDFCFIPNGYDKTFSELGYEFKNKVSARKRAIEKLKVELERI